MRKQFKHIALIDDDQVFNFITTKIITKSTDFQVTTYTNAQPAIQQFDTWSISEPDKLPDIIFLDINMPVMDGWEFLEALQKTASTTEKIYKVFIFFSSISSYDIEKSKQHRMVHDFVSKPLTTDKLNTMAG